MSESYENLMARAIGGDHQALTALLEHHGPAVRQGLGGKIPRRWQSVLSADDVMQQTYTDAFISIRQFVNRGEDSLLRWLSTLAKRNLLDALEMLEAEKRGGGRQRITGVGSEDSFVALYDLVAGAHSTPSRHAARDEARVALERAIGELPETYRRLIEMYDLQGQPVGEVAVALNRSHGAIYMLRARAHRQLRDIMGSASKYLSDTT